MIKTEAKRFKELLRLEEDAFADFYIVFNVVGEYQALLYLLDLSEYFDAEPEIWDIKKDGNPYSTGNYPWGTTDRTYRHGDYIVAYHTGLEYVSLYEEVE